MYGDEFNIIELVPGGSNINVDNCNKEEYVKLW